jgi:subtilisin family serine protease
MSRARAHRLALALFAAATLAATARAGSGATAAERDARLAAWDASEAFESFILSFPDAPETDTLDRALDELPAGSRVRLLRRTLRGAVLRLRASQARAFAERHPRARLERDAVVTAQGFRTSARRTNRNRDDDDDDDDAARVSSFASASVSTSPSRYDRPLHWGLDRVDQRRLPLDGRATRDTRAGAGAVLYVVDSGVFGGHADFGGRAFTAHDAFAPSNGVSPSFLRGGREADSTSDDCFGHGTAVASLAAGKQAGLAPAAAIVSIRVLDCDGNGLVSDVVSGLEAVAEHFDALAANRRTLNRPNDDTGTLNPKAVLTLSLGVPAGRASRSLDGAVRALAETRGVAVVAAAGNAAGSARGDDACLFSPGRARGAVTVGASDENDRAWVDGMTGRCVDLFAPGVGVLGASHVRRDAFAEWTGTSMAAPAVAGAILASETFDGTDGRGAAAGVLDDATDGALWDEWDEVDAFSDDARDGDGETERGGGVAFPWGRARFRGSAPGRVLPGTPNKLLFHRE